jgi:hypothetical protein
MMLFNIFLHFRRSFASSCHSGTRNSLNSGFTRRTTVFHPAWMPVLFSTCWAN